MTASLTPDTRLPSRRALLAGALGGLGALAASAIGRPIGVHAEGEAIVVGGEYTDATTVTKIQNQANGDIVLWGASTSLGIGVLGSSLSAQGLYGTSGNSVGVYGISDANDQPATFGQSGGNSTGVQGYSGIADPPPAKAKTGVYGYANQDSNAKGIFGESAKGFAGYFAGKVYVSKFQEMPEVSTPLAPGANKARLFVRDNGSGKTQLCVRFPTGSVQVLATQD